MDKDKTLQEMFEEATRKFLTEVLDQSLIDLDSQTLRELRKFYQLSQDASQWGTHEERTQVLQMFERAFNSREGGVLDAHERD